MEIKTSLYARLSTARGQEGSLQDVQLRALRELAERQGWSDVTELTEVGGSYLPDRVSDRPVFERMLAAVEGDPTQHRVAFYRLDRLTRDPSQIERILRIARRGAEFYAVDGSVTDLTTSAGAQTFRLLGTVAAGEVERIQERIRDNKRAAKRRLEYLGQGNRTWGFSDATKNRKPHATEAQLVREVARRVLDGESWGSLARDLNRRGEKTPLGKEWTANNLAKTLDSPGLYGLIRFRNDDGVLVEHPTKAWDPILTLQQRASLREVKSIRATWKGSTVLRHPLSNFIQCAKCGDKVVRRGETYQCKNNDTKISYYEEVEDYCRALLFKRLLGWQPDRFVLEPPDFSDLEAREEQLRSFLQVVENPADRRMLVRQIQSVEGERAQRQADYEAQKSQLPTWWDRLDTIAEWWHAVPASDQRQIYQHTFTTILLHPFDRDHYRLTPWEIVQERLEPLLKAPQS